MSAAPFTTEDFARRMQRAVQQAREAGLTGVLVTPGPDLVYFTGYSPIAITERITMLVISGARPRSWPARPRRRPTLESVSSLGA